MSEYLKQDAASLSRAEVGNAFLRIVYTWMAFGLAVTAAASWYVLSTPSVFQLIASNYLLFIGICIAEFALVIAVSAAIHKLSAGAATGLFILYSALNGVTLAVILAMYTFSSVLSTFITTAGMFGAFSLYGLVTKRDLTSLGSFAFMGLIGIIIAMIVNFFLQSGLMSFVISCVGVVVFVALTAYDTQKIRDMGASAPMDDATAVRRGAILGALTLYLDFINLFVMLLRLIGDRR